MNKTCPYCKEIYNLDIPISCSGRRRSFECKNHKTPPYFVYEINQYDPNTAILCHTWLYAKDYMILIYPNDKNMYIHKRERDRGFELTIPFDKNLTPDNIEHKLKTYLIFS